MDAIIDILSEIDARRLRRELTWRRAQNAKRYVLDHADEFIDSEHEQLTASAQAARAIESVS